MRSSLTFAVLATFQVGFVGTDASTGAQLVLSLAVAVVGGSLIVRASLLRRHEAALAARLRERERELREANGRLSRESRVDPLTGLANRLRLSEDFLELRAGADRYGRRYCFVLVDLDRFKAYNDALGHQAGDEVLQRVAGALVAGARDGDRLYRYGGEELLLMLPEQDVESGRVVAERHRAAVERLGLRHPRNAPSRVVTLSGGVAVAEPGDAPEDVLRRADAALYEAKARGRNRIAAESAPEASPALR